MIVEHEKRPSDSPCVETITYGQTESNGSTIRPAECRWRMVFVKHQVAEAMGGAHARPDRRGEQPRLQRIA